MSDPGLDWSQNKEVKFYFPIGMDAVLGHYKTICFPLVVWRGWGNSGNSPITVLTQEPNRERKCEPISSDVLFKSNLAEKYRFIFAFKILN
jgi:hypothetical protein